MTRAMLPEPSEASLPAGGKICAVMVTWNPDSNLERNIRALRPQVSKLIVVDNGSDPKGRVLIESLAVACDFLVLRSSINLGIATALNAGIRQALAEESYDWIGTFDDDSRVAPEYSSLMLQGLRACPFREQVALVGPWHLLFPQAPSEENLRRQVTPPFAEQTVMLQSGSLIRSDVFDTAGKLDGSFFIDYVDFEYCLRLRKHGFRIIEARNAVVAHEVGRPTSHNVMYKSCVVYNHSPARRYYAARNRLRVYGRYFFSEPRWILHDAWSWLKELIKLLLFESDKAAKLRCMARGVWDAVRGRSGMME